jgi:hypothetical protein
VRLRLPPGTTLPAAVRTYVIADVFPLAARSFVTRDTELAARPPGRRR